MKKIVIFLSCIVMICCACDSSSAKKNNMDIDESQINNIAELATLKCYYHNVAQFEDKDTSGFWLWKKDTKFWVEYGGTVEMGVKASKIESKIKNNTVYVSLPEAEVLDVSVDEKTLGHKSIIVEDGTTEPTAEDTTVAVSDAEKKMKKSANKNGQLLAIATSQAKSIIKNYIVEVGKCFGKKYRVEWTVKKK